MDSSADNTDSILTQMKRLLSSGEFSDVTFLVGDETKGRRFLAHRLILSLMSDVFRAMLYGPLAETRQVISVDDLEPEGFDTMLRYIYTDRIQLTSVPHAFETALAANKYMITRLRDRCINFISSKLSPKNVCSVLEFAILLDIHSLQGKCREIIRTSTAAVVGSEDFLKCRMSTVEEILKLGSADFHSQPSLFAALVSWSQAECVRQGLASEDALRRMMEPLLPKIDFLAMTSREFAEGPAQSGVLTQDESFAFLMNLACKGSMKMPPWASYPMNKTSPDYSKAKREPSRPRARMSAYAFFVETCRQEQKAIEPFFEFSKKCSNRWKALPNKEKLRFCQMAERDKDRYESELASYRKQLQKEEERKRKLPDSEPPKKPKSAFYWFCLDERPKVKEANPRASLLVVAKELGRRWTQDISDEASERYHTLAADDRVRYQQEVKSYKTKAPKSKKVANGLCMIEVSDDGDESFDGDEIEDSNVEDFGEDEDEESLSMHEDSDFDDSDEEVDIET